MTYTDRYNAIIHYFQRHPVDKTKIYCECHHIQPRSCGGSNDKENLVNLPAVWHYRVHCYLPFVMLEQNNEIGYRKMLYAWRRCLNSNETKVNLLHINTKSREYAILRESLKKACSQTTKKFHQENPNFISGKNNPAYNCHWWKNPEGTESRMIKEGDPVPEGWVRGSFLSEEQKFKCGQNVRGKIEITDGKHVKFVDSEKDISEGWRRGVPKRSKEAREKMSLFAKEQGKKYREKMTPIMQEKLWPLFECFYSEGFKTVQEKFGYKFTAANLCQQFRKYLPEEYVSKKKNHNRFR